MGAAPIGDIKLTDLRDAAWVKEKAPPVQQTPEDFQGANKVTQKVSPAPLTKTKSEPSQSQAPSPQAKFKELVDQVSRARSNELIEVSASPPATATEPAPIGASTSASETPKAPIGGGSSKDPAEIEVPEA